MFPNDYRIRSNRNYEKVQKSNQSSSKEKRKNSKEKPTNQTQSHPANHKDKGNNINFYS